MKRKTLAGLLGCVILLMLTTKAAHSIRLKASVRLAVTVQVNDPYGTYRNTGIWRVEVRKPMLALVSPFSTSLSAAPFKVTTRSLAHLPFGRRAETSVQTS